MKQALGIPEGYEPHVLYVHVDDHIIGCLGSRCQADGEHFHTTRGPVSAEDIIGFVGPLPDPLELLGRLRN